MPAILISDCRLRSGAISVQVAINPKNINKFKNLFYHELWIES